jgi:hypothetical protein
MAHNKNAHTGGNGAGAISDVEQGNKYTNIPHIPENSDLEKPPKAETKVFTDAVFNDLPPLLGDACKILTEQAEKEVFLVGALGVISGMLPNVGGFYDGQYTGCNLYCYILGAYGTGKGGLKLAHKLGKAVHAKRRVKSAELQTEYRATCIQAKENKEPEPPNPGNKSLFIPANNSKSGIVELLDNNEGSGIIFETEADSLADALKTDYGGFSDILRKAFHHEPITFFRRIGSEYREIESPNLSVVLTSTYDQYLKLIPNAHNGLFSRFLHYRLSPNHEFKNVFDKGKREYPGYFEGVGNTLLAIYNYLETLKEPIEIDLQQHQKDRFLEVFGAWKKDFAECVSTDLDGTVNRLGFICFRVAILLTAIRNFEQGDFSNNMLCSDLDFDNALRIVEVLKGHALAVFYDLPNPPISNEAAAFERELSEKANLVAQCQRLWKNGNGGKSYAEIAKEVLGDASKKSKVFQWLNR